MIDYLLYKLEIRLYQQGYDYDLEYNINVLYVN